MRTLLVCFALSFVTFASAQLSKEIKPDFVVSRNGDGDFETVQSAFDAVPDFRKKRTVILIRPGVYEERLTLASSKNLVSLIGEDPTTTVIRSDWHAKTLNSFGEEVGTTGSSGFFLFGNDFICRNVTFRNDAGPVGQAVAVRIDGDRVYFENCRFIGNQDTLYAHGASSRQYYRNCYIEGTVDFIFGWSTAFFEECEIVCKEAGYVTAASTNQETAHGFVFKDCRIVGPASKNSFYLGRPWRDYAKTVFIDCFLDEHIKPAGWHNWGKPHAEETTFYAEYGSYGPGAKPPADRVPWAHALQKNELPRHEPESVLGTWISELEQ